MKKRYHIDWTVMHSPVIRECHESDLSGKSFKKTKKLLAKRAKDKIKHWKKVYKAAKAATEPKVDPARSSQDQFHPQAG